MHNRKFNKNTVRKKSYKCGTCNKIFSKYDELGTHISTEHKKYFQCLHCGQNFSLIEEMKNHVKNVHAELNDENKCDVCNESFQSPELLVLHKKNEHESTLFSAIEKVSKWNVKEYLYMFVLWLVRTAISRSNRNRVPEC